MIIDLETALHIHEKSISEYGGSRGLRDEGALLAALARPFATFDQQDLYFTPVEKAASIFESIIINHPFIDGNKRTAYVFLRAMLFFYGFDVMAFKDDKYQMTIAASNGDIRFDEIKQWIEERLVKINT
jgi:death-on-curing protein